MSVPALAVPDGELPARLPRRIGWLPFSHAAKRPDAEAVVEGAASWSCARLAEAIRRAAALLVDLGVRPGDRIMVVGENGIALIVLVFAASEIDAWPVLVNARLTPVEVDRIRDHCRPRRAFYTVASSPDAARLAERDGAAAIDPDIVPGAAVGPLAEAAPEPLERSASRQVGALIYTSGTSGRPKGVMASHRNLLFNAATACSIRHITPADRMYIVLPITHIFGLSSVFLGGLMGGARIRLVPRFAPDALLAALADDGVSMVQGVPTMYARLVEHIEARGTPVVAPRLRFLSSGGAPLEPVLKARVERAFGVVLQNGYGLSEATPVVALTRLGDPNPLASIGYPPQGVEVRLVGEDGADVTTAATGELWTRGPNVMLGYYRDPELTAATITPDGWLKTGDLARAEPDGRLFIMGRKKELIIHSGFNVHPEEVEAALNSHPGVALSGVVGRPNGADEDIVAFVQPRPGAGVTEAELAAYVASSLAPYKRPARIVLVESLPATASGKVLRAELRARVRTP